MSIVVKGGIVENERAGKAEVEDINFVDGIRIHGIANANGGDIILTIRNVPTKDNYKVRDILQYSDGNNNNSASFRVIGVVGPCRYKLAHFN